MNIKHAIPSANPIFVVNDNLTDLYYKLSPHFSKETANPGSFGFPPSSGHCAVVALIVYFTHGGNLVSTKIDNQSHWYNKVYYNYPFWADLTGDQFDKDHVQVSIKELYPETRIRDLGEVNLETFERARKLADKADLIEVVSQLDNIILKTQRDIL
jgi:hypothetical protein